MARSTTFLPGSSQQPAVDCRPCEADGDKHDETDEGPSAQPVIGASPWEKEVQDGLRFQALNGRPARGSVLGRGGPMGPYGGGRANIRSA